MQGQASPLITQKLPLDSQGFTTSFSIHDFDPQKVTQFYNKFGFVVFDNVINQQEIDKTVDQLWQDVQSVCFTEIDRSKPESWDFQNVPYAHSYLSLYGFVNNGPFSRLQMWKNRANPNVYKAFKRLYELSSGEQITQPMLALFDRGSMLRPSKFNPEWKTQVFRHFDIQPWWWTGVKPVTDRGWRQYNQYNQDFGSWLGQGNYVPKVKNFTKLQGVLALSPTGPKSGGFACVCGFQNYITQWCSKNPFNTSINDSKQLVDNFQEVYQRAGSLLVFSRELPHNIYPNESQNFRYAQYLRMAPQSTLMLTAQQKKQRKHQVRYILHPELPINDAISRELYMLDEEPK